jgi:hypothetical protein
MFPLGIRTHRAQVAFRERPALTAMANFIESGEQGFRQMARALPVALQKMERHALGGFRAYARQAAQGPHQLRKGAGLLHGCTEMWR